METETRLRRPPTNGNFTIFPNPFDGEEGERRFRHQDLTARSLAHLWGERVQLELALAARLTRVGRTRILAAWPRVVDERQWLITRIRAIRRELHRRGARRG
jgi:hypothetical protein